MKEHPFRPGLASLVWPIEPAEFLAGYWQQKPLHVRGSADRLDALCRIFCNFDLIEILRRANLQVTRIISRRPPRVPSGQINDVGTLLVFYDAGVQLYIGTSELQGVQEWLDVLNNDIGTIWQRSRGDIYATRAGGGIGLHFDKNDNFTIQLRGRKIWRYSAHEHYDAPLHNHFSTEPEPLAYDPTYQPSVPRRVLRDLEEVVLGPGDMLYVPRGFWHGTDALDDSLSFNLSLHATPWSEGLAEAIQVMLIRSPEWRQTATRDPAVCAERLADLGRMIQGLQPDDLLRSAATPALASIHIEETTWLRRNPLVWWHTPSPKGADPVRVELIFSDRTIRRLTVARMFLSLLGKLPGDGRAFHARALLSRWRHERDDALEFLAALVATGLISVVPGDH